MRAVCVYLSEENSASELLTQADKVPGVTLRWTRIPAGGGGESNNAKYRQQPDPDGVGDEEMNSIVKQLKPSSRG